MQPLEIAARFAAFAWYTQTRSKTSQAEARRFSDESWQAFLPVANEGMGRLLLEVAKMPPNPAMEATHVSTMVRGRVMTTAIHRKGDAMYHNIEFAETLMVDLEISSKHFLERMLIRRGTRLQAQIKPFVMETEDGPVEMADLYFADGTITRMVPFESFSFVD